MAKKKDSPGQVLFTATFHERRRVLQTAALPTVEIVEGKKEPRVRKVKPRDIYVILRVLDDHGQLTWIGIPQIAAEARIPRNSVIRTIAAMLKVGIICCDRHYRASGGYINRYSIAWNDLALLCPQTTVPRGDHAPSPLGKTTVPPGQDHRPHVGTPRIEMELENESRGGNELRFPNFSGVDLSNPLGITSAIDLLAGIVDDQYTIILAAIIAVRKGKRPSALFVKLLRDGWGKFTPADSDHEAAKQMQRIINGYGEEDRRPAYSEGSYA